MSDFEEKQIDIQERNLKLETWKAKVTIFSMIGAILGVFVTFVLQLYLQNRQAADAFTLQAAEIIMAGRGSSEANDRLAALKAFFPDKLSDEDFLKVDTTKISFGRYSKRDLLTLLAAHADKPTDRAFVLKIYKQLFPNDAFVNKELIDAAGEPVKAVESQ